LIQDRRREWLCIGLITGSPVLASTGAVWAVVIDDIASPSFWIGPVARTIIIAGSALAVVGTVTGCLALRDRLSHRLITACLFGPAALATYWLAFSIGAYVLSPIR
jgi:hypothetical protein